MTDMTDNTQDTNANWQCLHTSQILSLKMNNHRQAPEMCVPSVKKYDLCSIGAEKYRLGVPKPNHSFVNRTTWYFYVSDTNEDR